MSDPFHIRGDYIKGMLYEVRRQYLHADGSNSLVPPQDYMTKKQSQTALKIKRDEAAGAKTLNNILVFKNQHTNLKTDKWYVEVNNRPIKKQENSKKSVKRKPAVILIEKFSSTCQTDWREQLQAGCKIWVNCASGEVTSECPWSVAKDEDIIEVSSDDEHAGTGSIVYDGEEFGQFIVALDNLSEKSK